MQNQIQTLSFDTLPVQFSSDAFLNATAIAKHFGKRAPDFLKSEQTQEYITALAEHLSKTRKIVLEENQLVITKHGGNNNGTWLHPKLAIHFARWLNPKFAVWCDEQIENLLSGSLPKQIAPKKSKTVAGGLTLEQVEQVQAMHKMLVGSVEKTRQGALAVTLWSAIKAKFGCNYKEIPPEYFLDVLSLMSRTAAAKNAQWQQTGAPELKFNDCGIGKALFNLGRGELSGGDVETALYDMAQIQSAIAWMNYAAYSECTATDSQLENLNYASNALNNLSAMLMEAAAETLKH